MLSASAPTTASPVTISITSSGLTTSNISGTSKVTFNTTTNQILQASPPTTQAGELQTSSTTLTGTLKIGGITYTFQAGNISGTPASDNCVVVFTAKQTGLDNLAAAMSNGAVGPLASGTTTWKCAADVTTDSTATATTAYDHVSGGSYGDHVVAVAAGSTGYGTPTTPTNLSYSEATAASDGTTSLVSGTTETFAYWSGNDYVSPSTLAATITGLINLNTTLSSLVTATQGTGGNNNQITIAADNPGTSANLSATPASFTAFTGGSLSGGTNGATTTTNTTAPTFAYWSGSDYATSAAVATNMYNALHTNTTMTRHHRDQSRQRQVTFMRSSGGPYTDYALELQRLHFQRNDWRNCHTGDNPAQCLPCKIRSQFDFRQLLRLCGVPNRPGGQHDGGDDRRLHQPVSGDLQRTSSEGPVGLQHGHWLRGDNLSKPCLKFGKQSDFCAEQRHEFLPGGARCGHGQRHPDSAGHAEFGNQ